MLFLCPFLGLACVWDITLRKIPNILQGILFGLGIVYFYLIDSWGGVLRFLSTVIIVVVVFCIFFKLGMIGGGDVKLLGISSAFFTPKEAVVYLFFTFAVAGAIGLIKLIARKDLIKRLIYLKDYLENAISGVKTQGKNYRPRLYLEKREEKISAGVAMSLPMMVSALLHVAGVY
ncbi:MAG: A24 family peptidase [Lachnospiraceae bacterium]|nr:A24 family peptidase [Lachnospiraceae bacterium]